MINIRCPYCYSNETCTNYFPDLRRQQTVCGACGQVWPTEYTNAIAERGHRTSARMAANEMRATRRKQLRLVQPNKKTKNATVAMRYRWYQGLLITEWLCLLTYLVPLIFLSYYPTGTVLSGADRMVVILAVFTTSYSSLLGWWVALIAKSLWYNAAREARDRSDDYEHIDPALLGRLVVSVQMTRPGSGTKFTKAIFKNGKLSWFQENIQTWSEGYLGIKTDRGDERWNTDYDHLPENLQRQIKDRIPINDHGYLHGFPKRVQA